MAGNSAICRRCRRAGDKLFLKGLKCRTAKCPMERRASTPGQHPKKQGAIKLSEYGKQLAEKQKVKLMYGALERQFSFVFKKATALKGVTGENLLFLLERRIDNVVFRLKMAYSKEQARQFVVHGHVNVNGKRVSSPSYMVKQGDIITINDSTLKNKEFVEGVIDKRMNIGIKLPEWLELDKKDRKGTVLRLPIRSDITAPIQEHLIVELYSK